MSLTQVFQFMHEESWASVTWSWTFAGWRVLNLGCTSDWTQHSSISGSKMACVNYAAFVIVIKNNHLCYILYYILVQTRMIWCLKYFFHILKIGNEKKTNKPATEQCQHPFCLCVGMSDTSSLYIFFVLLSVWSFDLFLAVIPSHRYTDFVALTADFMIFVTWIWNLVVFDWLFFPGAQLWLLSLWLWFAVGATFQPASHMWCSKLLWELGEDDPSCSCDTRYQCEAAPQHHGPPLCFTLAGVGANKPWNVINCVFFNPFWYFPPCRTAECKLCAVNLFRRHCTGGNIICGDVASCLFEPSAKLLDRDFPQILNFFPWLSPNTNPSSSCIGDACITDSEELLAMTSLFGIYCRNLNLPLNSTSCLSTVTQSL